MVITTEMVIPVIGVACALFAFGYAVGSAVGRADGASEAADWYNKRRRR